MSSRCAEEEEEEIEIESQSESTSWVLLNTLKHSIERKYFLVLKRKREKV